jgi:hypothetical protein
MNGKRTDISAGKENRAHHVRIRGKAEPATVHIKNGAVFQPVQLRIRKKSQKKIRYQFACQQPSPAVLQEYFFVLHSILSFNL